MVGPTALFMSNARSSMACIPALRDLELKHVSTIGFGDFPMAESLDPLMTVIGHQPRARPNRPSPQALPPSQHPARDPHRARIVLSDAAGNRVPAPRT
jgi:LacI family transcriptional regulator